MDFWHVTKQGKIEKENSQPTLALDLLFISIQTKTKIFKCFSIFLIKTPKLRLILLIFTVFEGMFQRLHSYNRNSVFKLQDVFSEGLKSNLWGWRSPKLQLKQESAHPGKGEIGNPLAGSQWGEKAGTWSNISQHTWTCLSQQCD